MAAPQARIPRYQDQPELAASIAADPTFSALEQEVAHERKVQAMKWHYIYVLTDEIVGQASKPFTITIEQGTDFKCTHISMSMFSYSATTGLETDFPMPNGGTTPNAFWAGRGLTLKITDTRSGRDLTSGDMPAELIATPGYGISFVKLVPFPYFFLRNSKIRFDIRNLDNANVVSTVQRTHKFNIALHGFKYLTPGA